jgi:hypothetical protein
MKLMEYLLVIAGIAFGLMIPGAKALAIECPAGSNDPHSGVLPFDMHWCDREPDNGLPLNPRYESGSDLDPSGRCREDFDPEDYVSNNCTTDYRALTRGWCYHFSTHGFSFGWFRSYFVTYPMAMFRGGPAYGGGPNDDDGDFDINIATPGANSNKVGVNNANTHFLGFPHQPYLHLEFNSHETTDNQGWDDAWWVDTVRNLDILDPDDPQKGLTSTFNTDSVIAIGPWVMDCHHECWAEVHPVLGLAILTDIDRSGPGPYVFTWRVFMRSQGDQNQCGESADHFALRWDPINMSLRFAAPAGATTVVVDSSFYTTPSSSIRYAVGDNQDVILTATQPNYTDYATGTIRIKWCASTTCTPAGG